MTQHESILKKLGLSEHEAEIYMLGLKLGPNPAREIAKQSGLGRTLVYHLLNQLKNKGLVGEQNAGHGKKFFMEPPERLLGIVERKQKEFEGMAIQISQVSKELSSLSTAVSGPPQIRTYEGEEGLKNIAQETLSTTNQPIKSIVPIDSLLKIFNRVFLRYWFLERKNKNIRGKTIFMGAFDKPDALDKIKELLSIPHASSTLHQWKKSPQEVFFPNTIIIYGNRVAVASSHQKPSVFVVESGEYAETMTAFFDDVWKRSAWLKTK